MYKPLTFPSLKGPWVLTEEIYNELCEDFPEMDVMACVLNAPAWSVHVAPIATGNNVMRDSQLFGKLADSMRTVLGVEMEAAAIAAIGPRT